MRLYRNSLVRPLRGRNVPSTEASVDPDIIRRSSRLSVSRADPQQLAQHVVTVSVSIVIHQPISLHLFPYIVPVEGFLSG